MLGALRPGDPAMAGKLAGHLAMVLFSLLVAGSFSFGKLIAGQIDPVALTTVRFALAAVLLGSVLAITGRLKPGHYRQPWRYLLLGGVFVIYFIMMFEALKTATPISTAAVFTLMPLFAGLFDRILSKRRQRRAVWGALAIGGLGALWVIFGGDIHALIGLKLGWGEFLFLIGTMAHAAYAAMVPHLRRGEPVYATTLGVVVGGALVLTFLFWPRLVATDWTGLSLLVWGILAYLIVFASLGTFSLVTIAAMRLPSAKVTAYTYLTPCWVVLIESLMGHGWPGLAVLAGGIPILAALLLLFLLQETA